MKQKYVLICLVVIILVGLAFFIGTKSIKRSQKAPPKMHGFLVKEVTITLDAKGFSPNAVTIKSGTPVRWVNKSGKSQTVSSDNYPTNQLHRQLNFGVFNNGSSVTYTFMNPGVYGYHNQFIHTQEGKVTVVQ